MNNAWWKVGALSGFLTLAACADATVAPTPDSTTATTNDGVTKVIDGKSDAWNWRNNPTHFRTEFDYAYDNLPSEGAADRVAWAASYWPYYEGGINHRWQGSNVLSPAEKYDKAFNNWSEPEGFMDLNPWNAWTCEWDAAYYDALGPAAEWTDRNKGTWLAHNGVDDDDDGVADADECEEDPSEWDGLESWWGICHAWAPAAIMEDEPMGPVERNGVTFDVSDIKALLIQQYDRTSAYMVGGRCNERELERDDNGRIIRSECRDLNAGSWHVIVTNLLGNNSRPFVIERTTNYEVWNQPLVGYDVTEQREVSLEEAHELLDITMDELDSGNGEVVHDIEEETFLARAILDFANAATLVELDEDAGLDVRAARNIVAARPIATLADLDQIAYVGSTAFRHLSTYVQDQGLVDAPEYLYNSDATRFIEVRMTTDWITESHASTQPQTENVERYTRHDYYHYILELNDVGEIIGGEWVGSSNLTHPDFVWLPTVARGGNPNIDIEEVRAMIRESRVGLDGGDEDGDDGTDARVLSYTSDAPVSIPDNDPNGATSVLEVDDSGAVRSVRLDLDIDHTYRGDLLVQLVHGGVVITVYDGQDESSPWDDDVNLSGHEVDGFLGAPVSGEWELRVFDSMGADVGDVVSWTIHVQTN